MFIAEAVPALVLSVVVFSYMTNRPERAKWLKDDERAWLIRAMSEEASRTVRDTGKPEHEDPA